MTVIMPLDLAHRSVSPGSTVTVHIVERDLATRSLLLEMLQARSCKLRIHEDAGAFLSAYDSEQPDCLVLDLEGDDGNARRVFDLLGNLATRLPTLVLSLGQDVERIVAAIQSGAVAFAEKGARPERLRDRLEQLLAQAPQAAVTRRELRRLTSARNRLTAREAQVFDLLGRGMTAKQIAGELGVSIRTAHIHRTNVMLKFGVETPVEMVHAVARLRAAAE
jgi:FixJ family two-component response regulator